MTYYYVVTRLPDGRTGRIGPYTSRTAAVREAADQRKYRHARTKVVGVRKR